MAWLEDTVAWFLTDQLKEIKAALETPILTGEDIYLLNGQLGGFKKLIDERAVDIVHPDLYVLVVYLRQRKSLTMQRKPESPEHYIPHNILTLLGWLQFMQQQLQKMFLLLNIIILIIQDGRAWSR